MDRCIDITLVPSTISRGYIFETDAGGSPVVGAPQVRQG